jgi:hypothetical protein
VSQGAVRAGAVAPGASANSTCEKSGIRVTDPRSFVIPQ